MNKLIITIAIMALSQAAMGEEKNTLEKAQEVAQRTRADADREYAKGVAKRSELHQWSDAADAVKRIQARYDQHEGIRHKAQVAYDRFKRAYGWCWGEGSCHDHERAAGHWQTLRDATYPNIAIAKADIKPSGTTMNTELARTRKHLEWAKREKASADNMKRTVRDDYERSEYDNVADHTVNTANAEITWAEKSVKRAIKVVNAVSHGALEEVRQLKYKLADTYVREQRVIHEAEQAVIAKKQAAIVRENEFLQLMKQLLYSTRQ